MNKLVVLSVLTVLFFSSCGSYVDNGGAKAMRISGILSVQPSNDPNPGTHLLSGDDLKVYPVSSILVKLSDPKYLGNKVELIGSFDPSTNLFSVSGISVLEELKDLDSELNEAVLVEYKNSDFGFQTKYYDNFTVLEEENKVIFSSPNYETDKGEVFDKVEFAQFQFSYDSSVFDAEQNDSPLKNYLATNFPEISNFDNFATKIGPDLLDSVRLENEFGGDDLFLYRNGLIYRISFIPSDALNIDAENKRIFEEMVNNFTFIGFTVEESYSDPSVATGENEDVLSNENIQENQSNSTGILSLDYNNSDFAGFESKSFGFKSVYPKQWYYEGINSGEPGVNYSYVFADNDTPSMDPLYSLSVVSSMPNMSFKDVQVNGVALKTSRTDDEFYAYIEISGKKFLCKGSLNEETNILATILNVSLL
ncbi:MAG: hypothetical protein RBS56_03875 [Candidatus Gracilibacteria bacterium]|jgi:hypothetical protein|nr:hypothetical protein [Candidatus Gracilibacteria bacterium]